MLKKLIITILLAVSCFYVKAQFLYGVKVSGGIATQYINEFDINSTNIVTTFNVSGTIESEAKYGFWLQSGLGYAGKGSVLHDGSQTTTTHLNYLELPLNVMRKFKFTDIGNFYLGAGGYFAEGLNGSLFFQTPGSSSEDYVRYGNDNDYRKVDIGVNFLTGFELKNKLTFDIQYSLGLNNIASDPLKETGTTAVKNKVFSFGLGYLF
jgi:hypothetical protein